MLDTLLSYFTWQFFLILFLIILIYLSSLFSGAETALTNLSMVRVKELVRKNVKHAKTLEKIKSDMDMTIATILVVNNLVNITASAIMTYLAVVLFGNIGVGIAIGILTFLLLVFGEISPKIYATENSEKHSLRMARTISALTKFIRPVVKAFVAISAALMRLIHVRRHKDKYFVTEETIKSMLTLGEEEGSIEGNEKKMILGVFDFGDEVVKNIMIPRVDIVTISENSSIEDAEKLAIETGVSRIPVYGKTVDKVKGILHVKDLLGARSNTKLQKLLRKSLFVPENKFIDDLLKEMQKEKIHIAIVLDEYGGVSGLITLEDIIETIVGEIYDEFDTEKKMVKRYGKKALLAKGTTPISLLNEKLKLNLAKEHVTIGGLVQDHLARLPQKGENIELDTVKIIVLKMEGTQIKSLRIEKK